MNQLIKNTAYLSMTELSLVVVAFTRNKFLAIKIGPEGFGIYGLLLSFFSVISIFSGVFLSQSITKYISEYYHKNNMEAVQKIATFSILLTAIVSIVITLLFLVARKTITAVFLSEEVLSIYFFYFTISFVGTSLRPIFEAIFQGVKRIKSVIVFRLILSITDILLVVILVSLFDLTGFFASIFISSVLIIILVFKFYKKGFKKFLLPSFNEPIIKKLLLFGVSGILLGLSYLGGQYFIRLIILRNISIEAVGLFTAAMAIVANMGIINRGIMFSFFPDISKKLSNDDRNQKINNYLRIVFLINIPITAIIILFGKQVLLLLFSSEFLALTDIFYWFALVFFVGNIAKLFYFNLMGMALIKNFTFFGVLGTFLFIAVPILFIKRYGLASVALGYLLSYIITIPCYYWVLNKKTNFRFSNNIYSLSLIAILTIGLSIMYRDSSLPIQISCGIISLLLTGLLIKKKEYNELLILIKSMVNKRDK